MPMPGTGAVGIEALSRGASARHFSGEESRGRGSDPENLARWGSNAPGWRSGIGASSLAAHPGDIVFLDPPYEADREYELAMATLAENPPKLVVVQHSKRRALADRYGQLHQTRVVRQGDNALSFYAS